MMMTKLPASGSARPRKADDSRPVSSSPPGHGRTDHTNDEIRLFLSAIFRQDERFHLFPVLREEFVDSHTDDPSFPASLHGHALVYSKQNKKTGQFHRVPLRGPTPLSTTLESPRFNSMMDRLRDLNDLNYDIYVCPNPLAFSKRCQSTVIGVRWLLLESDEMSKEEQYAFLNRHRSHFRVAVDSGRRSVQMLLPIRPIRNPRCICTGSDLIWMLKSDEDTTVELPEFDKIASRVAELARREGFIPDTRPLTNFAGLIRCPGFRHPLTGNMARLVHLRERDSKVLPDTKAVDWDRVAEDRESAVESLPAVEEGSPKSSTGNTMLSGHDPDRHTFLDDLEAYGTLRDHGIPGRHQRVKLHQALFTMARVWGWDEARLGEEWSRIVSIHPANIGCSVENAVQDALRHWRAVGDFEFHLPNTTVLPELEQHEIKGTQQKMETMGCPDSVSASRIIAKVLYPKVQECPQACQRGTAAVPSRCLQAVSVRKRYKPALQWLDQNNILVLKNPQYLPGQRSRLYFVNIPAILWLLGFRSRDLVWKWDGVAAEKGDEVSAIPTCNSPPPPVESVEYLAP
jgi:hypothetical protein